MERSARFGYLMMVITAVAWSGNAIVGRGVHETVPPIGLAFWRWAATLPIFLLLAWPHLKKDLPLIREKWPIMLLLSVLAVSIYNSFIYIALTTTTATNSYLINTTRPMIIVLMSLAFFRVAVGSWQAVGLAMGVLGAAVVISRGDLAVLADLDFIPGDIWVVVATTCWALYTVMYSKRPKVHGTSFMLASAVLGLAALLPFYLAETILVRPVPIAPETFIGVAYLSLFASVIAYMSYNKAVEILGPNKAGLTSYLLPVFGIVLAITILDESFRPFHAVGVALLLGGVYLATRTKHS